MANTKPKASLSLDLDNQWSYMKTHGDPGWETFPSYLDILVPRVLRFLKDRGLTITFFIVGQDAALEKNRESIAAIAAAGHEIGNHSFKHEQWFHLFTEKDIETELERAEESIAAITGQRPVGFRGPGFSLSPLTLRVLARRGYLYDASKFPTFLGPLARVYYFMSTKLSAEEMQRRKQLFGKFREGLQPIRPYQWKTDAGTLIEIPVTTMPIFRLPFHISYLLYLAVFAPRLAMMYFKLSLSLCQLTGIQPSLLLHPLDFLGCDDVEALSFFPAMGMARETKLEVVSQFIGLYMSRFQVTTMSEQAQKLAQLVGLPVMEAIFENSNH